MMLVLTLVSHVYDKANLDYSGQILFVLIVDVKPRLFRHVTSLESMANRTLSNAESKESTGSANNTPNKYMVDIRPMLHLSNLVEVLNEPNPSKWPAWKKVLTPLELIISYV